MHFARLRRLTTPCRLDWIASPSQPAPSVALTADPISASCQPKTTCNGLRRHPLGPPASRARHRQPRPPAATENATHTADARGRRPPTTMTTAGGRPTGEASATAMGTGRGATTATASTSATVAIGTGGAGGTGAGRASACTAAVGVTTTTTTGGASGGTTGTAMVAQVDVGRGLALALADVDPSASQTLVSA